MTCDYVEYYLSSLANVFLKSFLVYGHELDKSILRNINIDNGYVTTFLPHNADKDKMYHFQSGHIANSKKSLSCIVNVVFNFLAESNNNISIFEDSLFGKDDTSIESCEYNIATFNNEVYYYLTSDDASYLRIQRGIVEAEQPNFFVGILTSTDENIKFYHNDKTISQAEMNLLVFETKKIIIGAYDGEGYLIWHKRP